MGALIAASLGTASLYIHRGSLGSLESIAQLATVAVGLASFVALSTIARIAHARALERSLDEVQELSGQLRSIAQTDPLTSLYNLRAFHARLGEEIDAAATRRLPVSLVVADLDNFKLLNDSFGHQYGDEVLRSTADVFAACGGAASAAARLGGDEFALVLPGSDRERALAVAASIEVALREIRIDERQPATLGSFGIGTYPNDGATVQSLFAAADSRMYSEKHRRKAESLSSLAGAARKLFVRVGQAMSPGHSMNDALQQIAMAAKEEFALTLCVISVESQHQEPVVVAAARERELEATCLGASATQRIESGAIAGLLPGEAWIIETPIQDDGSHAGMVLLAGMPMSSFRPDAPVALALADLVQAVIASSRAQFDAARAGRERDIYIDLARAIAGSGSLDERLGAVTRMIAEFIGVMAVSIEGLDVASGDGATAPYNIMSGATGAFLEKWQRARSTDEARAFLARIAAEAPCLIADPANDSRIPEDERRLLARAGIASSAICPVRFDGQVLGVLAAASDDADFFDESSLDVLMTIADHLAPSIKVALLRDELEASYSHLEQASRESLARLADAAEARDPHTGGHLRRIRDYSVALALELGLDPAEAHAIGDASTIHDLGKLQLPDAVLMNPGKLTDADWERMREHPAQGERLIGDSPMFTVERTVARWHHERWDGSGYPDGLAGEQIPLAARIVAVADAFDALTTVRPYKRAWTLDEAFGEIMQQKSRLFCPTVVDALESLFASGQLVAILAANAGVGVVHGDGAYHEDLAA
jgi:diguanylate cyclase (GGDEF)-like protein